MNPQLLALLLQISGMYVAQAQQHAAAGDHPQTAANLSILGSLLSSIFTPPQPAVLPTVLPPPPVPQRVVDASVSAATHSVPIVPFPPGRA